MIRFRLKELVAEKEMKEKRRITLDEIAAVTGISRPTLSRIANQQGYSTSTVVLDRLCGYFPCGIEDLVVLVTKKAKYASKPRSSKKPQPSKKSKP